MRIAAKVTIPTRDLRLEPLEGCAIELLIRSAVREAICDGYIGEELEYATLHSQLVQVGIQEGEDALGQLCWFGCHCVAPE